MVEENIDNVVGLSFGLLAITVSRSMIFVTGFTPDGNVKGESRVVAEGRTVVQALGA